MSEPTRSPEPTSADVGRLHPGWEAFYGRIDRRPRARRIGTTIVVSGGTWQEVLDQIAVVVAMASDIRLDRLTRKERVALSARLSGSVSRMADEAARFLGREPYKLSCYRNMIAETSALADELRTTWHPAT